MDNNVEIYINDNDNHYLCQSISNVTYDKEYINCDYGEDYDDQIISLSEVSAITSLCDSSIPFQDY